MAAEDYKAFIVYFTCIRNYHKIIVRNSDVLCRNIITKKVTIRYNITRAYLKTGNMTNGEGFFLCVSRFFAGRHRLMALPNMIL